MCAVFSTVFEDDTSSCETDASFAEAVRDAAAAYVPDVIEALAEVDKALGAPPDNSANDYTPPKPIYEAGYEGMCGTAVLSYLRRLSSRSFSFSSNRALMPRA